MCVHTFIFIRPVYVMRTKICFNCLCTCRTQLIGSIDHACNDSAKRALSNVSLLLHATTGIVLLLRMMSNV